MTRVVHRGDRGASGRAATRGFSGSGRPTPRWAERFRVARQL